MEKGGMVPAELCSLTLLLQPPETQFFMYHSSKNKTPYSLLYTVVNVFL